MKIFTVKFQERIKYAEQGKNEQNMQNMIRIIF